MFTDELVVNVYNGSMGGVNRELSWPDDGWWAHTLKEKDWKMVQENVATSHKYVCFQHSDFTQKTRTKSFTARFLFKGIDQLVEKYGYDREAVRKGVRPSTGGNPFV